MENNKCNHLLDILRLINNLQRRVPSYLENNTCSRPILGQNSSLIYNTRPVTFFLCNNEQLTISYTTDGTENTANIFRVESVSDSSVTVRLLSLQEDGTYVNTDEFATINIDCICAIRCLNDTNISL